jgi:transcriptional regulator with XRE-family HTH domain
VLREWRGVRGMSKLDLAGAAETTTRHLSFVKTGRAKPTPKLLHRLAQALDMPLRDRNGLLRAAGFASAYGETPPRRRRPGQCAQGLRIYFARPRALPRHGAEQNLGPGHRQWSGSRIAENANQGAPEGTDPNLFRAFMHHGPLRDAVVDWEDAAR